MLASLNLLRVAAFTMFRLHSPSAAAPFIPLVTLLLGACALWGLITGIGLLRRKRWSRISIRQAKEDFEVCR